MCREDFTLISPVTSPVRPPKPIRIGWYRNTIPCWSGIHVRPAVPNRAVFFAVICRQLKRIQVAPEPEGLNAERHCTTSPPDRKCGQDRL